MAYSRHEQDLGRLQNQIEQADFTWLLRSLRQSNPTFTRFRTWLDVITFMREGDSRDRRKDDVLRGIFEAHGTDQDPRWRTALMVIFWPALCSIHRQKARWDNDPEELWQNITWTFLRVVSRIDIRRRPYGLVQKVFNDTVHHLWDNYRRQFVRASFETLADPEDIESMAGADDGIDYERIGLRLAQEAETKRLRGHLEAGLISEEDYLLLIGTRVYGKSAAEYAREQGLSSELMRKRRLRAEAAIRRHESIQNPVPENPPPPPFL